MKPYLVVGQGIAGTLLSYLLYRRGYPFRVIDSGLDRSASFAAAGLVNPVTGKFFTLSWEFGQLSEVAIEVYRQLEADMGADLLAPRIIHRAIHDAGKWNDWYARMDQPAYMPYVHIADQSEWTGIARPAAGIGEIRGGFQVDIRTLLSIWRDRLIAEGLLIEDSFLPGTMSPHQDGIGYDGEDYEGVILCDGAGAAADPVLSHIPFQPVKGEALIIRLDHDLHTVYKDHFFLSRIGPYTYWTGATYAWHARDHLPERSRREEIVAQLDEILLVPYEIVDHRAGIRPAVRDRRPVVGPVGYDGRLLVLNGLGTKGTSLAPWCARSILGRLLDKEAIPDAIDVRRFKK